MIPKNSFEGFEFNDRLGETIRIKRIIRVMFLGGDGLVIRVSIGFQRSSRLKIGSNRLNSPDEPAIALIEINMSRNYLICWES